ncbi:aarF domain-containing protein kinase 1-like isoform X5 [Biomphalaria glabrata]|uniref:AarF domain-containing protein kinase 1-like isoform X5 n=1 Tax=Biomphalaria glabrata TaxID=6526 RepID=A0A9W2ZX26_BIOGL|nr:aarF domain-containing protein kinase 1-like isoform X5 [Biomphalaria glabrata]
MYIYVCVCVKCKYYSYFTGYCFFCQKLFPIELQLYASKNSMLRLKKLIKIVLLGGVSGGTFYLTCGNDLDLTSFGVVRFGRAALAAVCIAVDYKLLFSKYDKSHPEYSHALHQVHLKSSLRLRNMCCKNGGVFIKVGQHLGSLDYLLPEEYVQTMKVLHNQAPQSDLTLLKQVIEEDLGRKFLVHALGWVFPDFNYIWLAEETKKNLPVELDFLNEGMNCERIGKILSPFKFLKVPAIYWNLSSDRVLTMEFCEGGKVDNVQYMKEHNISVNQITERLGQLYSQMIFVEGYVHCDPHPGNVLVHPTDSGPQIILLDHGLYQTLTDDFRMHYSKMWLAMINADVEGMKTHATALNVGDLFGLFACMLTARSWKSLTEGIDKKKLTPEENMQIKESVSKYLMDISTILNRVPRQMLLLLKTNDVLRGIEQSLKSHPGSASFMNMSRCCIKAVTDWELNLCHSWHCYIRIKLYQKIQLARLSLYSVYLWFTSSTLATLTRKYWSPAVS